MIDLRWLDSFKRQQVNIWSSITAIGTERDPAAMTEVLSFCWYMTNMDIMFFKTGGCWCVLFLMNYFFMIPHKHKIMHHAISTEAD